MCIRLGACTSGWKAYVRFTSSSKPKYSNEEAGSNFLHGMSHTAIAVCCEQRTLARTIVRSTASYIAGRDDVVCNAKLFFSLKQAIEQLGPKEVEHAECVSIMQQLQTPRWQFGCLVAPVSH